MSSKIKSKCEWTMSILWVLICFILYFTYLEYVFVPDKHDNALGTLTGIGTLTVVKAYTEEAWVIKAASTVISEIAGYCKQGNEILIEVQKEGKIYKYLEDVGEGDDEITDVINDLTAYYSKRTEKEDKDIKRIIYKLVE